MPEMKDSAELDADCVAPYSPRRRAVLLGLAVTALEAGVLGYPASLNAQAAPAQAPVVDDGFLKLSQRLCDNQALNPVTARRIRDALGPAGVTQANQIAPLIALAQKHATSDTLLQAADQAGMKDLALGIVAAWYTGTVGAGENAVVVAYQEALMYQPVRDALPVPTYCNFGPMWWSGAPPDVARMPADPVTPGAQAS